MFPEADFILDGYSQRTAMPRHHTAFTVARIRRRIRHNSELTR
jgi:hypothetical protein